MHVYTVLSRHLLKQKTIFRYFIPRKTVVRVYSFRVTDDQVKSLILPAFND